MIISASRVSRNLKKDAVDDVKHLETCPAAVSGFRACAVWLSDVDVRTYVHDFH